MSFTELFRTAITALRSSLLRTSLTMLGIVIGITAVILILIISQGATNYINSQFSSLGADVLFFASNDIIKLTLGDAKAISDSNQVTNIDTVGERFISNQTLVANGQNTSVNVIGASPNIQDLGGIDMALGSFIGDEDNASISRVAVLGPQVVKDLFGEGANPVGQTVEVGKKLFRVIGVAASKNSVLDDSIYIPISTAMRVVFGVNYVQAIAVRVKDPAGLDQTEADVKQLIFERHSITDQSVKDHFLATSSKDILSTINNVLGILTLVLSGIAVRKSSVKLMVLFCQAVFTGVSRYRVF